MLDWRKFHLAVVAYLPVARVPLERGRFCGRDNFQRRSHECERGTLRACATSGEALQGDGVLFDVALEACVGANVVEFFGGFQAVSFADVRVSLFESLFNEFVVR